MKLESNLTPCTHQKNSKWLTGLNIRQNIIILLEVIQDKIFPDLNHINVFLCQSSKAIEINKNKPMGHNQTYKICTAKEIIKKNTTYGMGENVSNNAIPKGLASKIYYKKNSLNSTTKKRKPKRKNWQKTCPKKTYR